METPYEVTGVDVDNHIARLNELNYNDKYLNIIFTPNIGTDPLTYSIYDRSNNDILVFDQTISSINDLRIGMRLKLIMKISSDKTI